LANLLLTWAYLLPVVFPSLTVTAADFDAAAGCTNEFGLDLYRRLGAKGNVCISPYSVSCALAMTLAGADGETRSQMAEVLHAGAGTDLDRSFRALQKALDETRMQTEKVAADAKPDGGATEPIVIWAANRLFPQTGYDFHREFFSKIQASYGAAPEPVDFQHDAAAATKRINDWVADQTRNRIRDLIPRSVDPLTRLVLVNAIYLKAPWSSPFQESATNPGQFNLADGQAIQVRMMHGTKTLGYRRTTDYTVVALPYLGRQLQLVLFVPNAPDTLALVEQHLDSKTLLECAKLSPAEVDIHLPKLKLEPPTIPLAAPLQALGMRSAFDIPRGTANFDRIAQRKPDDYLALSQVFHKTFIALDENGTEAAAATALVMSTMARREPKPQPVEVKVDRPFAYVIQHVPSGTCLFLGRVTDPR
jgi:serpin B